MSWIRLFNYGIGIHLLQSEDPGSLPEKGEINPKDNHISFQVSSHCHCNTSRLIFQTRTTPRPYGTQQVIYWRSKMHGIAGIQCLIRYKVVKCTSFRNICRLGLFTFSIQLVDAYSSGDWTPGGEVEIGCFLRLVRLAYKLYFFS